MTIGLLLLTGLSMIFVNSTQANRELRNTAQQIENGRYASDILTQDLHHAGFFGRLYIPPTAPASADPCETDPTALTSALAWPVQGYRAADLATRANITGSTCDDKGLLTNANLQPGSDVVVIRRAGTQALAYGSIPVVNDVYMQATGTEVSVQVGTITAITSTSQINGTTACTPYCLKGGNAAPVRKYMVHVYFVAPCSVGRNPDGTIRTDGVCTGSAPVEDTIPTLKRLELVSAKADNTTCVTGDAGCTTKMKIVPLVEGIEYLKVEYGIDNLPGLPVSTVTGFIGDASVDSYTATPADWTEVIAAKAYLLARNPEQTTGYADSKSYILGTATVAPADYAGKANFRRHTYTAATRLTNVAGRREIP
jgi:type IV pilus assembly protein PilW